MFGPEHPRIAEPLGSLGNLLTERGELDEAARVHSRALAVRTAALGPDALLTARSEHNLGHVRLEQGHTAEALRRLDRAAVVYAKSLAEDDPQRVANDRMRARARHEVDRAGEVSPAR